ncbi:MAG: lipopolysaccharide kinase InaA family protein [Planctomycetota bacterium]|nr:lipopolysaccharide kinase InaA family protein [Planctomycetota bacterium]
MHEVLRFDATLQTTLHAAGVRTARDLLALGDVEEPRRFVGFVDLPCDGGVQRFHLKRYRYAGWRESRGLLGRGTLWGQAPELREFEALATLRAHGVPAVRPAAACALHAGGRLVAHALLTVAVDGAHDLQACLADPTHPLRTAASLRRGFLRRLGAAVGAMHALPFLHRDLRARNILVRVAAGEPEFWLLDCRRGGARGRGGRADDLAALDRDLQGVLSGTDRMRVLRAYLGPHADGKALVAQVGARRALLPPPRPS